MSQKTEILNFLMAGERLTGIDGLKIFGTLALRNRISELRAEGHDIRDRVIEQNGKRFKEYYMVKQLTFL